MKMAWGLRTALSFIILAAFVSIAQGQTGQTRCYTCLYAERQGERPTGLISCLDPTISTVRSEACSGHCYKIDVREVDRGVQYLQRGCLPTCRSHDEYPVAHYGVGAIHCCDGDRCNSAPTASLSLPLLLALALSTIALICVRNL